MTPHAPSYSGLALCMADALRAAGARFDDEVNCIVELISARWHPTIIDMHIDEAREHAAAGRGFNEIQMGLAA